MLTDNYVMSETISANNNSYLFLFACNTWLSPKWPPFLSSHFELGFGNPTFFFESTPRAEFEKEKVHWPKCHMRKKEASIQGHEADHH